MVGAELGLKHNYWYKMRGEMPNGATTEIDFKMLDVVGCLGTKGIALGDRYKHKDAYDIVSVLDHYGNEVKEIADAFLQFLGESEIQESLERETERRLTRGIFAKKATRVLRTILNTPDHLWKITELANICRMSPAGVYFIVNQLEDKGYILRGKDKDIKVVDSKRLLKDWASNWTVEKSKSTGFFSFAKSTEEIISKVSKIGNELKLKYALTGMAGASMVSPFVRYNDVWLYVSGDIDGLVKKLDLRPTTSGANIRIFEPYDEGVFMGSREIRDVNVVSNIQLYVDLFSYPARGQEQAERLLEKNLKVVDVS